VRGTGLDWVLKLPMAIRSAFLSLARALESFDILCALLYGRCVEEFDDSDTIDLLVLIDDDKKKRFIAAWIRKIAPRIERCTGKQLSYSITTLEELGRREHPELNEALRYGVQLAGKLNKEIILRNLRQSHVLVAVDTTPMKVRDRVALREELFGREMVILRGPKAYRVSTEGVISQLGGIRVGDDAFVIPKDKAEDALNELKKRGLRYFTREVFISQEEIRRIKAKSPFNMYG